MNIHVKAGPVRILIAASSLLMGLIGANLGAATLKTIESYTEIASELSSLGAGTLVLWDIDGSLITSPDMLVRNGMAVPAEFRERLNAMFPQLKDNTAWLEMYSKLWLKAKRVLIEPYAVHLIKQLQGQGCQVLGFTAMHTDSHDLVGSLPVWRANMLASLGIEFSNQYSNHTFTQFASCRGSYPVICNGLFVTNMQPKGMAFGALCDLHGVPKEVVFFDDELKYLEQVGKVCDERQIPCRLFHYTGMKKMPGVWNTERALAQVAILMNKNCWISDQDMGVEIYSR